MKFSTVKNRGKVRCLNDRRDRLNIRLILVVLSVYLGVLNTTASENFSDAQTAAREGRYKDVVAILSEEIEEGHLKGDDRVIAFANRGIAHSLMKAYGLARQDLMVAIKLDPKHPLTQNHLGILAEHLDGDDKGALGWYRASAESGFAAGQVNLGNFYRSGKGVRRDYSKAMYWYQQAADQGYSMAFVRLGLMYQEGEGVPRNHDTAIKWFRKAADSGVTSAHFHLGKAALHGLGVPVDVEKALAEFRLAANRGYSDAQNELGYLYRRGLGVRQDFGEAIRWYRLAADQGHVQAMNRMAWLLATCPSESYCDGRRALQLAQKATMEQSSHGYQDTLAAAYARLGQFDQAIEVTREILDGLPPQSPLRGKYTNRLAIYSSGIPIQF